MTTPAFPNPGARSKKSTDFQAGDTVRVLEDLHSNRADGIKAGYEFEVERVDTDWVYIKASPNHAQVSPTCIGGYSAVRFELVKRGGSNNAMVSSTPGRRLDYGMFDTRGKRSIQDMLRDMDKADS